MYKRPSPGNDMRIVMPVRKAIHCWACGNCHLEWSKLGSPGSYTLWGRDFCTCSGLWWLVQKVLVTDRFIGILKWHCLFRSYGDRACALAITNEVVQTMHVNVLQSNPYSSEMVKWNALPWLGKDEGALVVAYGRYVQFPGKSWTLIHNMWTVSLESETEFLDEVKLLNKHRGALDFL